MENDKRTKEKTFIDPDTHCTLKSNIERIDTERSDNEYQTDSNDFYQVVKINWVKYDEKYNL